MKFHYIGYSNEAGVVAGRMEATSRAEVLAKVRSAGLKPLRVKQARSAAWLRALTPHSDTVGARDMILFARQLATMLSSGSNLLHALTLLETQVPNKTLRVTIESVRRAIDGGSSLSAALAQHPKAFDPLFVSVVEVGEYTGSLPSALLHIAQTREKERDARQRAVRAMTYPIAIIVLSFATMGVLMTVALPPLLRVFQKMGADIPVLTRVAIGSMVWIKGNTDSLLLAAFGVAILMVAMGRFERGRRARDRVLLRVPLVGGFIVAREVAKFSQVMAMLLDAKVPLATALTLGIGGVGNAVMRDALAAGEESLVGGHGLTGPLRESGVFPPLFLELLSVGEETNTMHATLQEAAASYQQQFEDQMSSTMAILEPASTVIVGAIVGFIAVSMFLPIYSGLGAV